ncbi:hypothetical protein T484DRAFT_1877998, partial [Baffinella frigidus]
MQMLQRSIAAPSLLLLLAHVTPSNGFLPGLLPAARLPPSSRGLPCSARLHKISRVATLRMAASLGPLSYGEEAASIDESIVVLDLQMRVAELPAGTEAEYMKSLGKEELLRFARARQRNVYGHDWRMQTSDGQGPVLEGAWALLQEHAAFREKWGLPPTREAGLSPTRAAGSITGLTHAGSSPEAG